MALTSLANYKSFAGISGTDNDSSLNAIIFGVDAAIKKLCRHFQFEPGTATDVILDAPPEQWLVLPLKPVRSITSLYLNLDANGDPSEFASDHLLTAYEDYTLEIDMPDLGWSRAGRVRRNAAFWGGRFTKPLGRLHAGNLEATPGAVKVTYAYGLASVPNEVTLAANLAVSLAFERRAKGGPVTSESLTGYSYSLAAPFASSSVIQSPDVLELLKPYMRMFC